MLLCDICKRRAVEYRCVVVSDNTRAVFCDLCAGPETLARHLLQRIELLKKELENARSLSPDGLDELS